MVIISLLIGILGLLLGFPLGNYLAKKTKEELKSGQFWFKMIAFVSFIGVLESLIFRNDTLFFTFAFIALVTSRSIIKVDPK